jgi:hypothetical protein
MLEDDDPAAAAVLFGFADAQRAAMEAPLPDFQQSSLRETLAALWPNDSEWLTAWNSGRQMSFADVVDLALRISSEVRRA